MPGTIVAPIYKANQSEKEWKILGGKTHFRNEMTLFPPHQSSNVKSLAQVTELRSQDSAPTLRRGRAPSLLPRCPHPRIKSSDISFNSESWLEGSTFNQVTNTQKILIQRNWVELLWSIIVKAIDRFL